MNRKEQQAAEILNAEPGEDPPDVSEETLRTFHTYLSEELSFPIAGTFPEPDSDGEEQNVRIHVTELLDPEEHPLLDSYFGLLCQGDEPGSGNEEPTVVPLCKLEVQEEGDNRELIEIYNEWYWNYR